MNDIQKCILDIYKEVAKLCNENQIEYFAIGGTCIGAIRHNGFIPWDDDLDIAIPIEQFDSFIEIAQKKLPEHFKVYTGKECKSFRYSFIKVIDTRTTFIEDSELDYPCDYKGVFIDIMPICGIPKDETKQKYFLKKQKYFLRMNEKLRADRVSNSISGQIATYAAAIIAKLHGINYFLDSWFDIMRKNPFRTATLTGYVWSLNLSINKEKLIYPISFFKATIEIPFEDTTIKCPIGYDKYLKAQFGDYMKLPPEKERVAHHYGIVDLTHSYSYYRANPQIVKDYKRKRGI